jgi:hypothetical protein
VVVIAHSLRIGLVGIAGVASMASCGGSAVDYSTLAGTYQGTYFTEYNSTPEEINLTFSPDGTVSGNLVVPGSIFPVGFEPKLSRFYGNRVSISLFDASSPTYYSELIGSVEKVGVALSGTLIRQSNGKITHYVINMEQI